MDQRVIEITAVGDIMLGDNHLHIGRGVASTWRGLSLDYLLNELKKELSGDIVIGNLECALGEPISVNPKRRIYIAPTIRAKELNEVGFTYLGLANNHILGHGKGIAEETEKIIKSAGLTPCGTSNPTQQIIDGLIVDVFNYSLITDSNNNNFYRNQILHDDLLQIESSTADYKIVYIHWGDEYSFYPSTYQIELAHEFLKRGVVLVLGHHPHVIQGVEMKDKRLIAYSLGNFIFDQNWSEDTKSGLILKIELRHGKVANYEKIFTKIGTDYVPQVVQSNSNDSKDSQIYYFYNKPNEYRKYCANREAWARKTMKKEVLKNLKKVSMATLLYPIVKRSSILEKVLFPK